MRSKLGDLAVVGALACWWPGWTVAQSSVNYAITQSTLNAGIGNATSSNFHLSSSLGDGFYSGPSTSANYHLSHGLWEHGVAAPPPLFLGAVSRKVHGAAGTFDLVLSLATPPNINHNPTTEPRQGPVQTIVFTFDKPLNAATVSVTEGVATAAAPTFSGNDIVVGLAGVSNQQYLTVSLTNVSSTDGGTGGSGTVRVGFLVGDVNQTRVVSIGDLGLVNAQLAQPVTATNFLKDVNASGAITVGDKGITNANLTKALPPP